ncbi:MAG: M3 family metallopeptidase [Chitinophagales bacterium]|nr:M3 family metallopeptidase [Chitinophagales bacterium]
MSNPLLTPFDLVPFSTIKNEHYLPAIKAAIAQAKNEIEDIYINEEQPNFENTIAALDYSGNQLSRLSVLFFNIYSSNADDEIQHIAMEVSPLLSEFGNDVNLNEKLFHRIKAVYEKKDSLSLTTEQHTLLENTFKNFARNGALLNELQKDELRELDKELSQLSLVFGAKVLNDTNAYELLIDNESDLAGLPIDNITEARETAKAKGKEGWLFTLDYPVYLPFVTYIQNRDLRKKMVLAKNALGFQDNENNTETTLLTIAKLKIKKANLLGYKTYADYVLEERMAKTPSTVKNFLNELLEKSTPFANKEFAELELFAKQKGGIDKLERWDGAYYSEQLKKSKFNLDEEELRPYFSLENVLNGVFDIAGELYNIKFNKAPEVEVYHPEVSAYKVTSTLTNQLVAYVYTDFFPRSTKRAGAWMSSFKSQFKKNGVDERPQVSVTCNFTKPTATKPSLLTFGEVTTLFHEFGHALHGMLSDTTYPSLSGPHVYWDFVELPSQIFENWCYEKEALSRFAKHYETGEVIPDALIEKIKAAASFEAGMQMLRQVGLASIDFGWHAVESLENVKHVKEYEAELTAKTSLYPETAGVCTSTAFSHIFQGGYSAGYYSYKWAEVLDADAFEYFKEHGIFNKEVAAKFKQNILAAGGSAHPMDLYKAFRGAEPSIQPLLKRGNLN